MTSFSDGSGSTSSSGGSCSSTSGMAAGSSSNPREAHVRLLLQPEVDQRRRQSARCLRLGTDTKCVFDERFKFPVSHDHLADKTLRFQVTMCYFPTLALRRCYMYEESYLERRLVKNGGRASSRERIPSRSSWCYQFVPRRWPDSLSN